MGGGAGRGQAGDTQLMARKQAKPEEEQHPCMASTAFSLLLLS